METRIPIDPDLECNDKSKVVDYEQSDHGNARRLLNKYGNIIRYHCSDMGEDWFIWDGTRWCKDKKQNIFQKAKDTIDSMYDELKGLDDLKQRNKLNFILRSKNQRGLTSMIASAQNEPGVFMEMGSFDSYKDIFNVRNGMIDLQTGELLPHDMNLFITKMCEVEYNTDATCPRWDKFLDEICPDKESQGYIQRFFGYALTGHNRAEKMLVLNGLGGNGKGVMLDTITKVMGDYTRVAESSTILKRKHERTSSNDLADLYGYRLVRASETAANQILDEARIKIITGGNTIKCRLLYKQYIEYIAQFKLVLETNHKPQIESQDNSIWRRVDRLDFDKTFDESDGTRDEFLRDTLETELEGVLLWMVNGAIEWYKVGLATPKAIADLNQSYKAELDEIGGFLEVCTEKDSTSQVSKKTLYLLYTFWCKHTEEYPLSKKAFGKRLEENGFRHKRSNGVESRTGIRIHTKLFKLLEATIDVEGSNWPNSAVSAVFSDYVESTLGESTCRNNYDGSRIPPCPPIDSDNTALAVRDSAVKTEGMSISQQEIADTLNIIRVEWEALNKPEHLSEYFDMFVTTLKVRCKFKDCDLPKESAVRYVNDAFKAWGWSTF